MGEHRKHWQSSRVDRQKVAQSRHAREKGTRRMEIYTLNISGVQDGTEFEDTVEVGPAPSLADAIMWERTALEQSGCTSIVITCNPLAS